MRSRGRETAPPPYFPLTTFYLIRHAERSGDQTLLAGRMAGLPLTPAGCEQAERIARHLAKAPIMRIVSSPIDRARETAAPLARDKTLTVEISEAFTEVDGGEWTGRTFAELDRVEQWRQFNRFRSAITIPGGESAVQVQERFLTGLLRLRDAFPGEVIAVFSHADPIKIALAYVLGSPLDFYDRLQIDLGSISIVTLDGWTARVLRINEVP
jgi:probable phosphoglycerate mutase